MSFTVYPAIDVRDGRVVRLRQGDYAQETRYDHDPLALAQRYAEAGAQWLHLVDLDAARAGGYTLTALVREITRRTSLQVQTGGGIRGEDDLKRVWDAGASRVVVGSVAVREPDEVARWLAAHGGERITLALDTRCDERGVWRLPVHGWTESGGERLERLLAHYTTQGLGHLLCTDIARDGMLSGPNLALYRHVLALAPQVALQASGGVRDAADVHAARAAGCAGVVLGKALLEARLELAEVMA
jgi:phosphoribosylformimino-5-aminoimidazole carboxamide ribotide isomerase